MSKRTKSKSQSKSKLMLTFLIALSILAVGCGKQEENAPSSPAATATATATATVSPSPTSNTAATNSPSPSAGASAAPQASGKPAQSPASSAKPSGTPAKNDGLQVIAKPESVTVLVNKQFALPSSYEPTDLVYPEIPFTFKEKVEKRKMRTVAADAIEELFAGAKKDGINLAGVSAYRSYATQKALFERYVKQDGEEKAKTYSAVPGTSEHETGLAIDVSGSDGKCAASDCFGGTKEAVWLEKHAPEYGFIIRYPKGKEKITGYQYEPWHIRYVGIEAAKEMAAKKLTMEEYYNVVPVAK